MANKLTEEEEVSIWDAREKMAEQKAKKWFEERAIPTVEWITATYPNFFSSDEVRLMTMLNDQRTRMASLVMFNPEFKLSLDSPSDNDDLQQLSNPNIPFVPIEQRLENLEMVMRHFNKNRDDGRPGFKQNFEMGLSDAMWSYMCMKNEHEVDYIPKPQGKDKSVTIKTEMPRINKKGETEIPDDKLILNQRFPITHVPSWNYRIDIRARANGIGGSWDGEVGVSDIEELRANPQLDMTGVKATDVERKIWEDPIRNGPIRGAEFQKAELDSKDPRNRLVRWKFFCDWRERRFIMIIKGHKKFVMNVPWPLWMKESIYTVHFPVIADSREFYQVPYMYPEITLNQGENAAERHLRVSMARGVPKTFYDPRKFHGKNLRKLADDDFFALIPGTDLSNLEDRVRFLTPPPPDQGALNALRRAETQRPAVGAGTSLARGQQGADTLGQDQLISNKDDLRLEMDRDRLKDALETMGRKQARRIKNLFQKSVAVKIGADWRVIVDKSEMEGDFKVNFNMDAVLPKSVAVMNAQRDRFVEAAGLAPVIAQMADIQDLVKKYLDSKHIKVADTGQTGGMLLGQPGLPGGAPAGNVPIDESALIAGQTAANADFGVTGVGRQSA